MAETVAFEEITIPVPWGHVSGKWWGGRGRQPIIALHGWQDNAGSFDGLGALLPKDISMLAIDFPGHGRSSHYPKGQFYYLFWDGVLLLRRIVKHFKWSKISIIGHSMGGAVGFLYAASFPDDIEKLISLDIASPTIRDTESVVNITGVSIDRFLKYESLTEDAMPCYTKDEMIDLVLDAYQGAITRKSAEILMIRGMSPIPHTQKNILKKEGFLFARDVRLKVAGLGLITLDLVLEYAKKIKCEYMNIRAVPGLSFDRPEYYTQVLDEIKKSACRFEYKEVDGSHHIHLNEPEKIGPIVFSFIKTSKSEKTTADTGLNGSSSS
ncbi:putative serine hydrolase [Frankliniella fusca]|uniref:Serine hydrolase n=1 Tax=Frankliniella fusca TaxID=407009 RepID=A0AAE1L7B9_9NEOP|nr:putative serine hydrolase [Frankliniella fusca]